MRFVFGKDVWESQKIGLGRPETGKWLPVGALTFNPF